MRIARVYGVSFVLAALGLAVVACGNLPTTGARNASVSELYRTEFVLGALRLIAKDHGYSWLGAVGATSHDGVAGARTAEASVEGGRSVRDHLMILFHDAVVDKLDSIGGEIVFAEPLVLDSVALFDYAYRVGEVRGYIRVVAVVDIDAIVRFNMVVYEH